MTDLRTPPPTDTPQARFLALLERHRGIVLKVAHTYCRDAEDRRDLAQEISAQLWRAFPGYDAARPFSTWAYRVALNVAISHARGAALRAQRLVPLDDDAADPDGAADDGPDDRMRALRHVLARLGDLDRALLLLYLDERPYREIAAVLGLSETNVATKISRLKERIRREIADLPTP